MSTSFQAESIHPTNPIKADAVFAGGGVRGIGHVGALMIAEQLGYQWVNIAGTSAGAIIAALVAADYSAAELYDLMSTLDYSRLVDHALLNWFHLGDMSNMLLHGGMHTGHYIEEFMRETLQAKGKQKFGDLIIKGQESDPRFRYRLTVIATDLTTGQCLRLPHDAHLYGLDPDEVDIAHAVRMSMSIPFFFTPVNQQHPDGKMSRIVDGGLISNFPISLFDVNQEPSRPTIGFRFVDSHPSTLETHPWYFRPVSNSIEMAEALLNILLSAGDRLYLEDHAYVRTINIPVDGIKATQFNLTADDIQKLYNNGKKAAQDFFTTWDFETYKAAYRRNNQTAT